MILAHVKFQVYIFKAKHRRYHETCSCGSYLLCYFPSESIIAKISQGLAKGKQSIPSESSSCHSLKPQHLRRKCRMQLWPHATHGARLLWLEAVPSNSIKPKIFFKLAAWCCSDCRIMAVVLGIQRLTTFNNIICADTFCLRCKCSLLLELQGPCQQKLRTPAADLPAQEK